MELRVLPDERVLVVQEGDNLLAVLNRSDINLIASCGGRGSCGRCLVDVIAGDLRFNRKRGKKCQLPEWAANQVLACNTTIHSDAVIMVPYDGRRLNAHKVLLNEIELENPYEFGPLFRRYSLQLPEPNLTENTDDLNRFLIELRKVTGLTDVRVNLDLMRRLPGCLREGNWRVSAVVSRVGNYAEVSDVSPWTLADKVYGLAVDIGTTTVKLNLVDLQDGTIIASAGDYNRQQQYGDDVINRIIYATEEPDGLDMLRQTGLAALNGLLEAMLTENGINPQQVVGAVVAGNTTMIHLFLGIPPKWLRLEPYIPAATTPQWVRGYEAGLLMNPQGLVFCLPAVGSYVGGDVTAGVLATQIARSDDLRILIDIGTNGEIVLGNRDFQISCACSAGPCFEGGGIKCGMRAMAGAIDKLEITPDYKVFFNTLEDQKPVGICGSGLINALAVMWRRGIIDRQGNLKRSLSTPRIKEFGDDGWGFVLVESRYTAFGREIFVLESEIKNVIRAKAAIFAGMRSLLNHLGLTMDLVTEVLIAGGFGNSLNIENAITIGMLPDLPAEKFRYVGNTALKGAQLVLTHQEAYTEIVDFSRGMTYLELSVGNDFMDEFISATFMPHTDLALFPSVR
ncbi:MAG: ASKHA domain-containing protein [Heliobacteriaceae bacterium]|nr:ASKHA domain-containing protein [Heliobacteriaceae bacterium]